MLTQMVPCDLADIGVFRIDPLSAARLGTLAKKQIAMGFGKAVFAGEPINHLLEGDPHRVLERTGAPDGREMGRRLDPWPSHALRFVAQLYAQCHAGAHFGSPAANAFAVALQRVTVAHVKLRPVVLDRKKDRVAGADFLHIEIAAVRAVVNGQYSAMNRSYAKHADHRLNWKFARRIPVNKSVRHFHRAFMDPEFLPPPPVWKHADSGQKRGVTYVVEFHLVDRHGERLSAARSCDGEGTRRGIDERKLHALGGEFGFCRRDQTAIAVDLALHVDHLARPDRVDGGIGRGERIFEVTVLGESTCHVLVHLIDRVWSLNGPPHSLACRAGWRRLSCDPSRARRPPAGPPTNQIRPRRYDRVSAGPRWWRMARGFRRRARQGERRGARRKTGNAQYATPEHRSLPEDCSPHGHGGGRIGESIGPVGLHPESPRRDRVHRPVKPLSAKELNVGACAGRGID